MTQLFMNDAVSVVIVTYNSIAVIEKALTSVFQQPKITHCYVVDNGSIDDTVPYIKSHYPEVQLIQSDKNLGFGVANNIALTKINTPFALIMNPDVILHEGTVDIMINEARHYPNAAIIAPKILDKNTIIDASFKRNVFFREHHKSMWVIPDGAVSVEYASGAVMLFQCTIMHDIGWFDENLFFYYEDDDLCLRVRQQGKEIIYTPDATVTHYHGSSSPDTSALREWKQQQLIHSRIYLEKKYHGDVASKRLAATIRREANTKRLLYATIFNKQKYQKYTARYKAACGK